MKTKDIKPGVVYGYRRGRYGSVRPVVFLAKPEPGQLYSERYRSGTGGPLFQRRPATDKPRRRKGYLDSDIGYPVVFRDDQDVDLAEMVKVTLDDFVATTKLYDRGMRYDVLTIPAHIVGPYDEAVAEEERQREARDRLWDEERAQREAACKRGVALRAALSSHGVDSEPDPPYEPTALVIPLDDVEKLLDLLGGAS